MMAEPVIGAPPGVVAGGSRRAASLTAPGPARPLLSRPTGHGWSARPVDGARDAACHRLAPAPTSWTTSPTRRRRPTGRAGGGSAGPCRRRPRVGIVAMWIYAFFGEHAGARPARGPGLPGPAEPICARAQAEHRRAPAGLRDAGPPCARADVVDQANDELDAMVDRAAGRRARRPSTTRSAHDAVARRLAAPTCGDRRDYTDRAAGRSRRPASGLTQSERERAPDQQRARHFAKVNEHGRLRHPGGRRLT